MRHLFLSLALSVFVLVPHAQAGEVNTGEIAVSEVWARASAGMARAGAAYMTLTNQGDEADRLINVESDVSKRTEIHAHLLENGIMRMTKIDAISVDPGSPTVLQPGGLHVMFMGLHEPLKQGQTFPLTLVFENAGRVDVTVAVQDVGSKGIEHHDHGKHGAHKHHNH